MAALVAEPDKSCSFPFQRLFNISLGFQFNSLPKAALGSFVVTLTLPNQDKVSRPIFLSLWLLDLGSIIALFVWDLSRIWRISLFGLRIKFTHYLT